MRVVRVTGPKVNLELGSHENWGSNRLQLITGQNGSGKSELLGTLIDKLAVNRKYKSTVTPIVRVDGVMLHTRVIAQTFSPFTRFAPEPPNSSLADQFLMDSGRSRSYLCLGLSRATRSIGASLSRRILEDSLFRLSEAPEAVRTTTRIMRTLHFKTGMEMFYRITPALSNLIENQDLPGFLVGFIGGAESRGVSKAVQDRIVREVQRSSASEFLDLLLTTIRTVERLERSEEKLIRYLAFEDYRASSEHHIVQSLAFLRRLELLKLEACVIRSTRDGFPFDIANASSGQQQMLCSIISLATALRDDSLILIDEPELSLHPKWQMMYMQHLFDLLEQFQRCHVLIATHSPLIVERGREMGADVIRMGSRSAFLNHSTLHHSVEETLINVFETPLSCSSHVANEIFEAINGGEPGTMSSWVASLEKLRSLQEIYGQAEEGDERTLRLISDAIELVEAMALETNAEDGEGDDE